MTQRASRLPGKPLDSRSTVAAVFVPLRGRADAVPGPVIGLRLRDAERLLASARH